MRGTNGAEQESRRAGTRGADGISLPSARAAEVAQEEAKAQHDFVSADDTPGPRKALLTASGKWRADIGAMMTGGSIDNLLMALQKLRDAITTAERAIRQRRHQPRDPATPVQLVVRRVEHEIETKGEVWQMARIQLAGRLNNATFIQRNKAAVSNKQYCKKTSRGTEAQAARQTTPEGALQRVALSAAAAAKLSRGSLVATASAALQPQIATVAATASAASAAVAAPASAAASAAGDPKALAKRIQLAERMHVAEVPLRAWRRRPRSARRSLRSGYSSALWSRRPQRTHWSSSDRPQERRCGWRRRRPGPAAGTGYFVRHRVAQGAPRAAAPPDARHSQVRPRFHARGRRPGARTSCALQSCVDTTLAAARRRHDRPPATAFGRCPRGCSSPRVVLRCLLCGCCAGAIECVGTLRTWVN